MPVGVERVQIVATADVGVADENLRHRPAAVRLRRHRRLRGAVAINADFLERGRLGAQQRLGRVAKGTSGLGVDDDRGHAQDILDASIRAFSSYYMCSHAPVTTLAKTSTSTRFAPALNSALEAALAVAPEVKTSSTSTTLRSRTTALSAIRNAPWTFSALCVRLKPTWLRVALTRRSAARSHGFPVWREISVASAAAWLNCRRHSRKACSGTGARRSASARMSAPREPSNSRSAGRAPRGRNI